MASSLVVAVLVLVPSLLMLVAGVVLLLYGIRRQRRDRESLEAYVGRRLQEGQRPEGQRPEGERAAGERPEGERPEGERPEAAAAPPPSQDNTGLVWAIVGGVLAFFGVVGLTFLLVVGFLVAVRSDMG